MTGVYYTSIHEARKWSDRNLAMLQSEHLLVYGKRDMNKGIPIPHPNLFMHEGVNQQ